MAIPCHLFSFPVRPWRNHRQSQENDHGLIEPRDGFLTNSLWTRGGLGQRGMYRPPESGRAQVAARSLARIQGRGTVYAGICVSGAGHREGTESVFGGYAVMRMPGLQGAACALGAGRERREASARFKKSGAGSESRTRTPSREPDFESGASTSSAIPAQDQGARV